MLGRNGHSRRATTGAASRDAHLAEFVEVKLEGLHVVLETEGAHGPQQIISVDGLPLLALALVAGPEEQHQPADVRCCTGFEECVLFPACEDSGGHDGQLTRS